MCIRSPPQTPPPPPRTRLLVEEVEVVAVQEVREELPRQPVKARLDGHVQPPLMV